MPLNVVNRPRDGRVTLGSALQKARTRIGFTVSAAACGVSISTTELGWIESGFKTPSTDLVEAFARLYGVEPERFGTREFVSRVPGRYDAKSKSLWLGWYQISFDPRVDDNEKLLLCVSAALRSMRSLGETEPVVIRRVELGIVAGLSDLEDPELVFLVMKYLRLTYQMSLDMVESMNQALVRDVISLDDKAFEKQTVKA